VCAYIENSQSQPDFFRQNFTLKQKKSLGRMESFQKSFTV